MRYVTGSVTGGFMSGGWRAWLRMRGGAAEMALEEEAITRFHKVLELLPGQQRDILLHCMKGEKVREIAEALGVSENTVKTQKKRAYEFVRDELGELWGVVAALFFM